MNNKKNKYNALGFVEALISIIIVGVSSVVLMRIAASALIDAVQNDKIDKATQYAVEGGNAVRELYESGGFPNIEKYLISPDDCFVLTGAYWGGRIHSGICHHGMHIPLVCKDPTVNHNVNNRRRCSGDTYSSTCKHSFHPQYPFFRVACMKKEKDYIRVKIVVGELNYDGKVTKSTNIKDYVYETTIPIKENE